jgi:acetylornithine deacetylase/succinyl-diaminopimelate desuccinylase-like protein
MVVKNWKVSFGKVNIELDLIYRAFDVTTFTGATDARFLRQKGIPAIGFSPFRNTPLLLHDHDEHLGVKAYLEGISIYESILTSLTEQ